MEIETLLLLDAVMDDYEGLGELGESVLNLFPDVENQALPLEILPRLRKLAGEGLIGIYRVGVACELVPHVAQGGQEDWDDSYFYRSEAGKRFVETPEVSARLDAFYARRGI
jgi:hypothetical protein